jgi:DNA invertase Pin-like site-specific DNA recombinase
LLILKIIFIFVFLIKNQMDRDKGGEYAILFIRCSTDQQSTDSQESDLLEYAKRDSGLPDDRLITIKPNSGGESASKLSMEERETIKKMYDAIKKYNVTKLYTWEITRLSRRMKDLVVIKDDLEARKINIILKTEGLKMFDNEGNKVPSFEILFYTLSAIAVQETKQRSERVSRGIRYKSENGYAQNNNVFYGYTNIKDRENKDLYNKVIVDDQEAKIVKKIFDWYQTGRYGSGMIQRELENEGVFLNRSYIHQILAYELYTGETIACTWKRKDYTSVYNRKLPQIITREQFDKCREIAGTLNTNPTKSKRIFFGHYLIKCSQCGKHLSCCVHGKQTYYNCHYCGEGIRIAYGVMDSILWWAAREFEVKSILEANENDIETIKNNIIELRFKLDNITNSFEKIKNRERKKLKKQFPHWTDAKLEIELSDMMEPEKKKFDDLTKDWERDITNYTSHIDEIEQKISIRKIYTVTGIIEVVDNHTQVIGITKNLDDSNDYKKRDIIKKYIREVRLNRMENADTPTLRIEIDDIFNQTRFIWYAYRKMDKDKRLYVQSITGNMVNFDWNDIYMDKFIKTKVDQKN